MTMILRVMSSGNSRPCDCYLQLYRKRNSPELMEIIGTVCCVLDAIEVFDGFQYQTAKMGRTGTNC